MDILIQKLHASGVLRYEDAVNDKQKMSQYTSILVGQTYLIAGNSRKVISTCA